MIISLTVIIMALIISLTGKYFVGLTQTKNAEIVPPEGQYIYLFSLKVISVICLFTIVALLVAGVVFFEIYYPLKNNNISWYLMMAIGTVTGLYWAISLHAQYFFFAIDDDYLEFNLELGKRAGCKVPINEILEFNKKPRKYLIKLKNGKKIFNTF